MASQILSAIGKGYGPRAILNFLARQSPKHAEKIRSALHYGYTAASILRHLTGQQTGKYLNEEQFMTPNEKAQRAWKNQKSKAFKQVLGGAGLVAGAGIGLPLLGALTDFPEQPEAMSPSSPSIPRSAPSSPPLQQKLSEQIETAPTIEEQEQKGYEGKLQSFSHLTDKIKEMSEAGNPPEQIANVLGASKLYGPIVRSFEEKTKKPFSQFITEQSKLDFPKEAISNSTDYVITPQGAGKIYKEKGKDSYVEVDNKLYKVPKSEISEPAPSAIEAVTSYLNIPEEDRSSNVALFAWNPEERRAYFQFHNEDSFYEYLDIDPEIVEKVARKEAIPVTSGGNQYGVWSPEDQESLGAALWRYIVNSPKYKKAAKGQAANPFYRKLPIKYDYWKKLRIPKKRK